MTVTEIQIQKAALRKLCLRRRRDLAPCHVQRAAAAVCRHVLDLSEYQSADLVHTYLSSLPNELDTQELIAASWARGKRIAVPMMRPGSRVLDHALITAEDRLGPDAWGLLGPRPESAHWFTCLAGIDLVLVPGVAFDRQGNRLGMGGGFYDRFLAGLAALRIGLTYSELLLDELPVQSHDVPMDLVVCPQEAIRCSHD